MTTDELAKALRTSYDSAPTREKAVQVVLFGIVYSEHLSGQSIAEVTKRSGIGDWGPQVSLGVNLSNHVLVKQ